MRIVVTGGAGFIGSYFVGKYKHCHGIQVIDNLGYTHGKIPSLGVRLNVMGIEHVTPKWIDSECPDVIINMAAETHVDRSIADSSPFITSNIVGVHRILESIRVSGHKCRLVQVSTDEVYGSADDGLPFTELTPIKPNNPYSASKASADMLCLSYCHTYGLDVVITRCSNNYGPGQYPEKLIPLSVRRIIDGGRIPIYGDGLQRRDWLHVSDHCMGIMLAATQGRSGEVYNFGSGVATANIDIARSIITILGTGEDRLEFVTDRPGHDRLYLMDSTKAKRDLNWKQITDFEQGLAETVKWYEHQYSNNR